MKYFFNIIDQIVFNKKLYLYIEILVDRIFRFYYKIRFKYYGNSIRWGNGFYKLIIPKTVRISNPEKIVIQDDCQFEDFVSLKVNNNEEYLIFGKGVRCNTYTYIHANSKINIEDYVLIAPFCYIVSQNHWFKDNIPIMFQSNIKSGNILICIGSWIGTKATILGNVTIVKDNVTIGKDSVIGANSLLLNLHTSGRSIIAGNPAKIIKRLNCER